MKLNYYSETDSLYIDLSEKPSAESREISAGVVLDYDAEGNLVGIDIDNASKKVQLKEQPMPCQKMIITRPGKKRNEKRIYFSKCGVGGSKVRKN